MSRGFRLGQLITRAATDLLVESVPDAIERFVAAGGTLLVGPFDIRIGLCAVLWDPWQNPLVILDQSKGLLRTDAAGRVIGLDTRRTTLE